MNKKRLSTLKALKKEAEIIREEIRTFSFEPKEYVSDTVKDYSTGHPRTIIISGYGTDEYRKAKDRLYNKLTRKMLAITKETEEMEAYIESIEDPLTRTILRLKYIEGKTQAEIAEELNYDERTIRRKLKDVL